MILKQTMIIILLSLPLGSPCQALPFHKAINTIAFGSCNHQDKEQPLWSDIEASAPDLWIWTGDVVYADSTTTKERERYFTKQKLQPDYQRFAAATPVTGTWDDHDYADNNSDRTAPNRPELQRTFLDFLNVSATDPRRQRQGIFTELIYGSAASHLRVIILDSRYFKSPWDTKEPTMLGDEQWRWLKRTLRTSRAKAHIIVSSLQVIPNEHRFERWGRFPGERMKLLELLSQVANPIILSGDRHIAEFSQIDINGRRIREITSSGMTHAYNSFTEERNRYRSGPVVSTLNFGLLQFDLQAGTTQAKILGPKGVVHIKKRWSD